MGLTPGGHLAGQVGDQLGLQQTPVTPPAPELQQRIPAARSRPRRRRRQAKACVPRESSDAIFLVPAGPPQGHATILTWPRKWSGISCAAPVTSSLKLVTAGRYRSGGNGLMLEGSVGLLVAASLFFFLYRMV